MTDVNQMIECYDRLKNLKLAAKELDMSFQTLYWHLKKAGVSVCGDKERYGSVKDKFAARAEKIFATLVPFATDMNGEKFQAKIDFMVGDIGIDVKAAKRARHHQKSKAERWMFSIKKQLRKCDYFVMVAFDGERELEKLFLIPAELIAGKDTISISCGGKSKWHDYEVSKEELFTIFNDLRKVAA